MKSIKNILKKINIFILVMLTYKATTSFNKPTFAMESTPQTPFNLNLQNTNQSSNELNQIIEELCNIKLNQPPSNYVATNTLEDKTKSVNEILDQLNKFQKDVENLSSEKLVQPDILKELKPKAEQILENIKNFNEQHEKTPSEKTYNFEHNKTPKQICDKFKQILAASEQINPSAKLTPYSIQTNDPINLVDNDKATQEDKELALNQIIDLNDEYEGLLELIDIFKQNPIPENMCNELTKFNSTFLNEINSIKKFLEQQDQNKQNNDFINFANEKINIYNKEKKDLHKTLESLASKTNISIESIKNLPKVYEENINRLDIIKEKIDLKNDAEKSFYDNITKLKKNHENEIKLIDDFIKNHEDDKLKPDEIEFFEKRLKTKKLLTKDFAQIRDYSEYEASPFDEVYEAIKLLKTTLQMNVNNLDNILKKRSKISNNETNNNDIKTDSKNDDDRDYCSEILELKDQYKNEIKSIDEFIQKKANNKHDSDLYNFYDNKIKIGQELEQKFKKIHKSRGVKMEIVEITSLKAFKNLKNLFIEKTNRLNNILAQIKTQTNNDDSTYKKVLQLKNEYENEIKSINKFLIQQQKYKNNNNYDNEYIFFREKVSNKEQLQKQYETICSSFDGVLNLEKSTNATAPGNSTESIENLKGRYLKNIDYLEQSLKKMKPLQKEIPEIYIEILKVKYFITQELQKIDQFLENVSMNKLKPEEQNSSKEKLINSEYLTGKFLKIKNLIELILYLADNESCKNFQPLKIFYENSVQILTENSENVYDSKKVPTDLSKKITNLKDIYTEEIESINKFSKEHPDVQNFSKLKLKNFYDKIFKQDRQIKNEIEKIIRRENNKLSNILSSHEIITSCIDQAINDPNTSQDEKMEMSKIRSESTKEIKSINEYIKKTNDSSNESQELLKNVNDFIYSKNSQLEQISSLIEKFPKLQELIKTKFNQKLTSSFDTFFEKNLELLNTFFEKMQNNDKHQSNILNLFSEVKNELEANKNYKSFDSVYDFNKYITEKYENANEISTKIVEIDPVFKLFDLKNRLEKFIVNIKKAQLDDTQLKKFPERLINKTSKIIESTNQNIEKINSFFEKHIYDKEFKDFYFFYKQISEDIQETTQKYYEVYLTLDLIKNGPEIPLKKLKDKVKELSINLDKITQQIENETFSGEEFSDKEYDEYENLKTRINKESMLIDEFWNKQNNDQELIDYANFFKFFEERNNSIIQIKKQINNILNHESETSLLDRITSLRRRYRATVVELDKIINNPKMSNKYNIDELKNIKFEFEKELLSICGFDVNSQNDDADNLTKDFWEEKSKTSKELSEKLNLVGLPKLEQEIKQAEEELTNIKNSYKDYINNLQLAKNAAKKANAFNAKYSRKNINDIKTDLEDVCEKIDNFFNDQENGSSTESIFVFKKQIQELSQQNLNKLKKLFGDSEKLLMENIKLENKIDQLDNLKQLTDFLKKEMNASQYEEDPDLTEEIINICSKCNKYKNIERNTKTNLKILKPLSSITKDLDKNQIKKSSIALQYSEIFNIDNMLNLIEQDYEKLKNDIINFKKSKDKKLILNKIKQNTSNLKEIGESMEEMLSKNNKKDYITNLLNEIDKLYSCNEQVNELKNNLKKAQQEKKEEDTKNEQNELAKKEFGKDKIEDVSNSELAKFINSNETKTQPQQKKKTKTKKQKP